MKIKNYSYIIPILVILFIIGLVIFLNIPVSTKQGINFGVNIIKIPLYLKLLNFMDRHYNYKHLVKSIIGNAKSEQERVMKIFVWTYKNIKKQPQELPIIDDHVWHIIIRRYGISDQFSDVFTTLCNYAGIDAYFSWVYTQDHKEKIPFSFVRIGKNWTIFDPYRGVYFKNKNGEIAAFEEIKSRSGWFIESLSGKSDIDYTVYLNNLPSVKDIGLMRSNIQSPLNRLIFEIKKILNQ